MFKGTGIDSDSGIEACNRGVRRKTLLFAIALWQKDFFFLASANKSLEIPEESD
jgi:hypothetical protein